MNRIGLRTINQTREAMFSLHTTHRLALSVLQHQVTDEILVILHGYITSIYRLLEIYRLLFTQYDEARHVHIK